MFAGSEEVIFILNAALCSLCLSGCPRAEVAQITAVRGAYPSDLPDARWELIEPALAAWRFERPWPGPGLRSANGA